MSKVWLILWKESVTKSVNLMTNKRVSTFELNQRMIIFALRSPNSVSIILLSVLKKQRKLQLKLWITKLFACGTATLGVVRLIYCQRLLQKDPNQWVYKYFFCHTCGVHCVKTASLLRSKLSLSCDLCQHLNLEATDTLQYTW